MLKTRIITALLLLGSLIAAAWLSPLALLAGAAFLVGAAFFELLRLSGLPAISAIAIAIVWAGTGFTLEALGVHVPAQGLSGLLHVCALAWLLVASGIVKAQRGEFRFPALAVVALGFFFSACGWFALLALLRQGYLWTFSVLGIVWLADIGAYAAGRAFGRRKLASRVSPGKTWEGVWGALAAVFALAFALAQAAPGLPIFSSALIHASPALGAFVLVLLVASSIVGDLFESLVKRQAGAKDSGFLLPGHGGVWDRIDALLPAVPLAVLAQLQWVHPR